MNDRCHTRRTHPLRAALSWAFLGALAVGPFPGPTGASAAEADTDAGHRPRVVLVLSGGGARGAAHVGVLRVLEEARVPVDAIVGTSMGSIVGGMYAAGMSPDELEQALVDTDWEAAFDDRPDREDRDFRRKQDDIDFVLPYKLRLQGGVMRLPMGLRQAQTLTNLLKVYDLRAAGVDRFDDLPIPFRAVAADLETGDAVVFDHGDLSVAMRASMSIPGVFPPVVIDGRQLVDGGIVANLPVEVGQSFEPDIIIAVDISTPLEGRRTPDTYLKVVRRLGGILTKRNVARDKERLGDDDILIVPDLGDITVASFARAGEAIEIGAAATREVLERLERLSVPPDAWDAWVAGQRRPEPPLPPIASVQVRNASPVSDDVVLARIHQRPGETLDPVRTIDDLTVLYGLEYFDPLTFDLRPGADGVDLVVNAETRATGITSLQFGLTIEEDFRGGSAYVVDARLQRLAVNRAGGESRTDVRIGDRAGLRSDFYQPLDAGQRWFVDPYVYFEQQRRYVVDDGSRLGQLLLDSYGVGFEVGRNFGTWGRIVAGADRGRLAGEVVVPGGLLPKQSLEIFEWRAGFQVDTLEAPTWPAHGVIGDAAYIRTVDLLGGETRTADVVASFDWALSAGRMTVVPGVRVSLAVGGTSDLSRGTSLGGVFRLSGLEPNELLGDESVLARLVTYYSLTGPTLGVLKPEWYLGVSLEAGDVFADGDPIVANELRAAGSVYLGGTSALGPVQVGVGFAEGGRHRLFVSIGRELR